MEIKKNQNIDGIPKFIDSLDIEMCMLNSVSFSWVLIKGR